MSGWPKSTTKAVAAIKNGPYGSLEANFFRPEASAGKTIAVPNTEAKNIIARLLAGSASKVPVTKPRRTSP